MAVVFPWNFTPSGSRCVRAHGAKFVIIVELGISISVRGDHNASPGAGFSLGVSWKSRGRRLHRAACCRRSRAVGGPARESQSSCAGRLRRQRSRAVGGPARESPIQMRGASAPSAVPRAVGGGVQSSRVVQMGWSQMCVQFYLGRFRIRPTSLSPATSSPSARSSEAADADAVFPFPLSPGAIFLRSWLF